MTNKVGTCATSSSKNDENIFFLQDAGKWDEEDGKFKDGCARRFRVAVTTFIARHVLVNHDQDTLLVRNSSIPWGSEKKSSGIIYYAPYYWLYLLTEFDERTEALPPSEHRATSSDEDKWFGYEVVQPKTTRVQPCDIYKVLDGDKKSTGTVRWKEYRRTLIDIADCIISALGESDSTRSPAIVNQEFSEGIDKCTSLAERRTVALRWVNEVLMQHLDSPEDRKYGCLENHEFEACNSIIAEVGRQLSYKYISECIPQHTTDNNRVGILTNSPEIGPLDDSKSNTNARLTKDQQSEGHSKSLTKLKSEPGAGTERDTNSSEDIDSNDPASTRRNTDKGVKSYFSNFFSLTPHNKRNNEPNYPKQSASIEHAPKHESDSNIGGYTRICPKARYYIASASYGCILIVYEKPEQSRCPWIECTFAPNEIGAPKDKTSYFFWNYWPKCIHKCCVQKLSTAMLARHIPRISDMVGRKKIRGSKRLISIRGIIGRRKNNIRLNDEKAQYEEEIDRQSEFNKILAELSQIHLRDTATKLQGTHFGAVAAKVDALFEIEQSHQSLVKSLEDRVRYSQHHFEELRRRQARKQKRFRNLAAAAVAAFLTLNIASYVTPVVRLAGGVSDQQIEFALTRAQIDSSQPSAYSGVCSTAEGERLIDCVREQAAPYVIGLIIAGLLLFAATLIIVWWFRESKIGDEVERTPID